VLRFSFAALSADLLAAACGRSTATARATARTSVATGSAEISAGVDGQKGTKPLL